MYSFKKSAGLFLSFAIVSICLADDYPPPPQPIKPLPGSSQNNPGPGLIDITPETKVPFPIPEVPFSRLLQNELLKNLPGLLLFNRNDNWGHQAHVKSIQGVRLIEVLRNHGDWEKMTVRCVDFPHRMGLRVDELNFTAKDRIAFTIHIDTPADMDFTKQTWQNGVQIYVGHSRARVRFRTEVILETGLLLDANGGIIGQDPAGFKVTGGSTCCYDFATEYVNGLGGDLAAMAGSNSLKSFKRWRVSLDREMNDKLLAAFTKTAGSPEVAAGYDRMMKTIASQDGLRSLLTARAPIRSSPLPELVTDDDGRPRGRIAISILAFAVEMLFNGMTISSEGSGHSSGSGHTGGSSSSSHESHAPPANHEKKTP